MTKLTTVSRSMMSLDCKESMVAAHLSPTPSTWNEFYVNNFLEQASNHIDKNICITNIVIMSMLCNL